MKTQIADITAIPLERSLDRKYEGGTYSITSRYTLVTEVRLTNGVVGQTYGGDEEKYQKEIARVVNGPFRDLLMGQDVFDLERNWEAMFNCSSVDLVNRGIHTLDLANKAIIMQAISAVDIACWDVIGRCLKAPVYKLMGAYRDKVPVIGIGGYYVEGKSDRELADELLEYKRLELAGIKLKVGRLSPADDAERVRFARNVVGDNFVIACDANQTWTVSQALDFCQGVRDLNVRWIEEPVRWYDQLQGLAEVRKRGGLPVVAGQGEITRFGCRDLMIAGAVDILNVDVTIAGGITEWRRVAGMASMLNISMAHHEEPQVSLHLLASVPHGLYVEIFPDVMRDPLWFELPAYHPAIRDGFMHVPSEPGLGIPLNEGIIESYRAVVSA